MADLLLAEFRGTVIDALALGKGAIPKVKSVSARRITLNLPEPVVLGQYVIRSRGFAVITVELADGSKGQAFGLDRGTPVADIVNTLIAEPYKEIFDGDPINTFDAIMRRMSAPLSSGASLRGLSLVDLAAHDAVARHKGVTVVESFGKKDKEHPKWAVVGYPPSRGPEDIAWEVEAAVAAGAVGVKLPVGANPKMTRERLEAALATGLCPVSTDLAWSCRTAKEAYEVVKGLDLAWVEDPFIPGSIAELVEFRRLLDVPLSSGDDETHLYHPQAFIETGALDMLRIDATCQGGLSRMVLLNEYMAKSKLEISWHVYDAIHHQVASIIDSPTFSVEYSAPGASVDPLAEMIVDRRLSGHTHDGKGFRLAVPDLPDLSDALAGPPRWTSQITSI
jgi:L-alanine-DL-glutamate epimerase-like enolase superfamily enzyme